jgi:hypothetical protein
MECNWSGLIRDITTSPFSPPSSDPPPKSPQRVIRYTGSSVISNFTEITQVLEDIEASINHDVVEVHEKILDITQRKIKTGQYMYKLPLKTLLDSCMSFMDFKT